MANAGGVVTHELGIIDAVAARLTSRQKHRVRAKLGTGSVFEDGAVELASAVSTVRDNFDQVRWTNDDGTTAGRRRGSRRATTASR